MQNSYGTNYLGSLHQNHVILALWIAYAQSAFKDCSFFFCIPVWDVLKSPARYRQFFR